MPSLTLYCLPAERTDGGFVQIHVTAPESECPLPRRVVEITRAADAKAAFDAYAAEVTATGKGAAVSMRLGRRDRSPPGFKALEGVRGSRDVNV